MDTLFRPFEKKDFVAVQEMHVNSFRQLATGYYTDDQIAAHERMFREPSYLAALQTRNIVLASIGDEIVGSAGWCLQDEENAPIRKVFVNSNYANRGLGRVLVGRVESEIRKTGFIKIFLRASLNAVPFYERLGYRQVKRESMNLVEDISVSVMAMQKVLDK